MSKSQNQLTLEEGQFWETLAASLTVPDTADTTDAQLAALEEKSKYIARSYLWRSTPPTDETYTDSQEVLEAMGVPCLDAGPHEAEGLASSLVLHGQADFVATEDTVCPRAAPSRRPQSDADSPVGRARVRRDDAAQHHKPARGATRGLWRGRARGARLV